MLRIDGRGAGAVFYRFRTILIGKLAVARVEGNGECFLCVGGIKYGAAVARCGESVRGFGGIARI